MNYTQCVAEVMLVCKRPEKLNTARRKVNTAISFFSLDNEFTRDFYEHTVALDAGEYTQSISIANDLVRFRKFKYLKNTGTKLFLKVLPDSELFKECDMRGRYYIAGDNVNLNLARTAAGIDLGYYQHPPVLDNTPTNNSYWMLDVSPYMIVEWAAAEVLKDIGDDKSYRELKQSAIELYKAFRRDQGISTQ